MEAAIGLQIAGDKGDERRAGGKLVAIRHREDSRRTWYRAAGFKIDAFRQQLDAAPRPFRVGVPLPDGWRLPSAVLEIEREQVDCIIRPHAGIVLLRHDEFRIEADILADDVVVELEIAKQRRRGENVSQIEQFSPAMMADDDIGNEAKGFDLACRGGGGL